jgi:hypothetical protein
VSVSTTDQTGKTRVFMCQDRSNGIGLWDGAAWAIYRTGQIYTDLTVSGSGIVGDSKVISGITGGTTGLVVGMTVSGTGVDSGSTIASIDSETGITMNKSGYNSGTGEIVFKCPASTNYDAFGVVIAGVPVIVKGPAWSSGTERSVGLTGFSGIQVLEGAHSIAGTSYAEGRLRHVGSVGTTATAGQTQIKFGKTPAAGGSLPSLLVWSRDNQTRLVFYNLDSTDSYTRALDAAWRYYNWLNSASNMFTFLVGNTQNIRADFRALGYTAGAWNIGIALDVGALPSSSENDASVFPATNSSTTAGVLGQASCIYDAPSFGRHTLSLLEVPNTATNTTFYGDVGKPAAFQSGAKFEVMA